jgi:hypothetical protein
MTANNQPRRDRAGQPRGQAGQFVCAYASPSKPTTVTERAFEAAKAPAGHPNTPRPDKITRRLGMPWAELLETVFAKDRDLGRTIGTRARRDEAKALTMSQAVTSIRKIAPLIPDDQITMVGYQAKFDELVAADRRRYAHGGRVEYSLLTAEQIDYAVGFQKALRAAGFASATPSGKPGWRLEEAIEYFIDQEGYVPSREYLVEWGKHVRRSIEQVNRFPEARDRVLTDRKRRRRQTPPPPPRRKDRPPFKTAPFEGFEPPRRGPWPIGECEQACDEAIKWLAGERLDQRSYARYVAAATAAGEKRPSFSSLQRAGEKAGKKARELFAEAVSRSLGR